MNISLIYLLTQAGKRGLYFFRHWYIDGFIRWAHWVWNALERLDRVLALRITARNWYKPLYQDYTIAGYFFGFLFRMLRIFVALVVYLSLFLLAASLFLFWSAIPIYAIYQVAINL